MSGKRECLELVGDVATQAGLCTASWWSAVREPAASGPSSAADVWDWYQLGGGFLGINSASAVFRDRFRELYTECRVPSPADAEITVRCHVSLRQRDLAFIRFVDKHRLDPVEFVRKVFPDRTFTTKPAESNWTLVGYPGGEPFVAFRDDCAVAPADGPWPSLLGSLAVNRVFRLQERTVLLHAASVAVSGKGVLISGAKASGKTTVSLALAVRNHTLLGDEAAAVTLSPLELLPMRRTLSLRQGPHASGLDPLLAVANCTREKYPDGTPRTRVAARDLFSSPPRPVPLRHIFLLRSLGSVAHVESFSPRLADATALSPFGSSLWGSSPAARTMRLFQVLSLARCHRLDVGAPEETAALIEHVVEASS
jgi:hypothetical protein